MRRPGRLAAAFAAAVLLFTGCTGDGPTEHDTAPAPAATPRPDGLSGAPVPPSTVASPLPDPESQLTLGVAVFPPLDHPDVVPASEATWMRPDSLVLGAELNGESRAYLLSMMSLHHVANDELGGEPYLVAF